MSSNTADQKLEEEGRKEEGEGRREKEEKGREKGDDKETSQVIAPFPPGK